MHYVVGLRECFCELSWSDQNQGERN